ncbi:bglA [Symbiodinium sp. CCMP2456]|nr:bglA [Symbiodinium sp. CCMP2456]
MVHHWLPVKGSFEFADGETPPRHRHPNLGYKDKLAVLAATSKAASTTLQALAGCASHIGKCGATPASITTDITMPIMPPLILWATRVGEAALSQVDNVQDPRPADKFGGPQDNDRLDEVGLGNGTQPKVEGKRAWSQWACALMCASRAADGCCSYKDDSGSCEFLPGSPTRTTETGWTQAQCVPGFGTAKCTPWSPGRCAGAKPEPASPGLPVWELIWEDHFDSETCVPDMSGVLRPSPEFWSAEIGYKRGKELQWYQPKNAECKDGALIITAKRERQAWEKPQGPQCQVVNWDSNEQPLDKISCAVCAPPYFQYYNPCDLVRNDDSGGPACDCSESAEFTSASLMTRGKKEFSYGLFELRAKIDTRPGAWSSWWAVGDFDYVPWPKNGEIDIMDAFQRMVKASVIHAGESGLPSSAIQHAGARMIDREWEKYYHTWQLEWDEDFIEIRIDGEVILKLDLSVADSKRTSWPNPFTEGKKFFMILNLAVGGHSGGDASLTQFPSQLHVDYIRVYQKKGTTAS